MIIYPRKLVRQYYGQGVSRDDMKDEHGHAYIHRNQQGRLDSMSLTLLRGASHRNDGIHKYALLPAY